MPDEEKEVRDYCRSGPLHRPRITLWHAILIGGMSEAGLRFLSTELHRMIAGCYASGVPFHVCYIALSLLFLLSAGRWFAILAVRLYQRYAPEDIRRKCRCRPTCSEYAVAAFRKYGLLRGGRKTYIRLTRTCKGGHYITDYP